MLLMESLNTKDSQYDHFGGSIIGCHYYNLRCQQWRLSCQIDDHLSLVMSTPGQYSFLRVVHASHNWEFWSISRNDAKYICIVFIWSVCMVLTSVISKVMGAWTTNTKSSRSNFRASIQKSLYCKMYIRGRFFKIYNGNWTINWILSWRNYFAHISESAHICKSLGTW